MPVDGQISIPVTYPASVTSLQYKCFSQPDWSQNSVSNELYQDHVTIMPEVVYQVVCV